MWTRVASIGAVLAGVALVVVTFSLSLFPRSYAGERVSDNLRAVMSPAGVKGQAAALGLVGGFVGDYVAKGAPMFARELHMSPAQYERFVAANYPAVAYGEKEIPAAAKAVVAPVVAQAPKIQAKYEEVTHIPGLGLPIAGAPWLLVLAGALLVGVGGAGLVRPHRGIAAAVALLGAGLVVVPLALNLPAKASDSGPVLKLGRIAVSQHAATAAHRTALAVDDMVSTMRFRMLPDLAARLHTTPATLDATISRHAPRMANGLREWPSIAATAYGLTQAQQSSVADFKRVDGIGYSGLEWVAIGPGIALLLLGGVALLAERRSRLTTAAN
jgi:hypothetical protein